MINDEMARAMRYRAAFAETWLVKHWWRDTERWRRKWLERHLIDLGRMENAKSETAIRNRGSGDHRRRDRGVGLFGAGQAGDHRKQLAECGDSEGRLLGGFLTDAAHPRWRVR